MNFVRGLLRLVPFAIGAAALAGVVHIGAIFAYPDQARDDAYTRIAAFAALGVKTPVPGIGDKRLPSLDPAMASDVCRFDLGSGPFRLTVAALDEQFLSLGMHSRHGIPFYGLNLRAGQGGPIDIMLITDAQKTALAAAEDDAARQTLRIVAPEDQGFVIIGSPVAGPDGGKAALDHVTCGGAAPTSSAP